MNTTAAHVRSQRAEEGYFLVGLVVICFLLLLALGIAAPRVAKQLEREREVESEHRAQEYVRAIQLYYRKNGRYPTSMEQLTGSNGSGFSSTLNVKYLRQEYKDPLTGGEYRPIHYGEAKTEVKGFFGESLQGVATPNLGSPVGGSSLSLNSTASPIGGAGALISAGSASSASQGFSLGNAVSSGSPSGTSQGFSPGGSASNALGSAPSSSTGTGVFGGAPQPPAPATNAPGAVGSGTGAVDTGTAVNGGTGISSTGAATATGSAAPTSGYGSFSSGSTSATSFQGNKGAIVGFASNAKGHGLVEWNGSENIEEWEFLYDPRVEQMKSKVNLFGGSGASGSSLGQGSNGTSFGAAGSSFGSGTSSPGFGGSPLGAGASALGAASNSFGTTGSATDSGSKAPGNSATPGAGQTPP